MLEIELNKKEVKKLFLNEDIIGSGAYGILKRFNRTTVAKVYYRDFPLSYPTHKIQLIDMDIAALKAQDKRYNFWTSSILKKDFLIRMIEQLNHTTSADLMKGVIIYKHYPVALLLEFYNDYVTLTQIYSRLSYQEKIVVLKNIEAKLLDLWDHLVFPTDFKDSNFMVRPSDLDVKLIDLDDSHTKYLNPSNNGLESHMLHQSEARFQKFKQSLLHR